jgi:hypothetical protein
MSYKHGYLKALWQDAFGRTWDDFADQYGKLWLLAYYAVAGLVVYVWIGWITDVPGELANWVQGLVAVGTATIGLILFRLLIAPYRIWKQDQSEIVRLRAEIETRRNWKEIGAEAELLVHTAQFLAANPPVSRHKLQEWANKATQTAVKAGDWERSMFATLPVLLGPMIRNDYSKELLQYADKMRNIMSRAKLRAEGRNEEGQEIKA